MNPGRRRFAIALGMVATNGPYRLTFAQGRVWRVGALFPTSQAASALLLRPFVDAARELGYVEGNNFAIEARYADNSYDRLRPLAEELVRARVDVIVAVGNAATQGAQRATRTLPIVSATMIDPVASGFAHSLARPGGNITGLANPVIDISGKLVELVASVLPRLSRVVVLLNSSNPVTEYSLGAVQSAAKTRGIAVIAVDAKSPAELDASFSRIVAERPEALIVLSDVLFVTHMQRIAQFALSHHIPSILNIREYAKAGGSLSYGQPISYYSVRTAAYMDKIFKGANPGDLPIEQPTKVDLVINRKIFAAMGIAIPPDLLIRADEVID